MKQTIVLTPKPTKWIFVVNGFIHSGFGLRLFLRAEVTVSWDAALGLLLMSTGLAFFVYGLMLFSQTSKLGPKIQVDEEGILINEGLFKIRKAIAWEDVKRITYGPYELGFLLTNNSSHIVTLATSAEISVIVKRTIRQAAERRQIEVHGG